MSPAPIPATFIVRRRRGAAVVAERRFPARVLDVHGDKVDLEYVRDDGRIRWCVAPADQVEVHP
ncbi:MAG: hypothetical protein WCS09_02930 [Pseudomonadota bacterium]|jgi:hypothetical protein